MSEISEGSEKWCSEGIRPLYRQMYEMMELSYSSEAH